MSLADESNAIDRYVAGLDVDERELLPAIAELALQRTLVAEALLQALGHPSAGARLQAVRSATEMEALPAAVTAALRALADGDLDVRVREAAGAALRITPPSPAPPPRLPPLARALASLLLGPGRLAPRSGRPLKFPLSGLEAAGKGVSGRVFVGDDGLLRIALWGLPAIFRNTCPAVRVRLASQEGQRQIAIAKDAVADDGSVTIAVPPEAGPIEDVAAGLAAGVELALIEEAAPGGDQSGG